MRKAGIGLANGVERAVDLLDDGQDLARIDVGQPPRHQHGVLLLGDEAAHQVLGQDADVLLHRLDPVVARLVQPAAQALHRPHVAEAGLLLQRVVHLGDDLDRHRREQRRAVVPFDHDVHGIGAGELLVDAARGIERLLAVGHLVGEPVARGQIDEGRREQPKQHDADQGSRDRAGGPRGRRSSRRWCRARPSARPPAPGRAPAPPRCG